MNQQKQGAVITFDESADLIAESVVESRLDLGHSLMYRLRHPVMGGLIVLNSAVGQCAMMAANSGLLAA